MAAAAVTDVPLTAVSAIQPSNNVDLIARSHIFTPPITLYNNGAVTKIRIPYVYRLTWTNFKLLVPITLPRKLSLTILQGSTILYENDHMRSSPEWQNLPWPIPSINVDDPLTVEVTYMYTDLPGHVGSIPIVFAFAGFTNLFEADTRYVYCDENRVPAYEVLNGAEKAYKKIEYPRGYRMGSSCVLRPIQTYINYHTRTGNFLDGDSADDSSSESE